MKTASRCGRDVQHTTNSSLGKLEVKQWRPDFDPARPHGSIVRFVDPLQARMIT